MREVLALRHFFFLIIPILLTGCLAGPPSPVLVQAALHYPGVPPTISGDALNHCLLESNWSSQADSNLVAYYNSAMTLSFMKHLSGLSSKRAAFAPRIRIYVTDVSTKSVFGVVKSSLACVYDFYNGKLAYLTHLEVDSRGSVDGGALSASIGEAYTKMAQIDPHKYFLLGDLAQ